MNRVPKLRFPEFSGEWEKKKLGELVQINTGKKDTQDKIGNGIYPFFVRSQTIERINSYSFDGEAILTAGDGVGVGKVFHYINGKFDYHQRVYKLSDFNGVSGKYLFEYFSANFIKEVTKYTAKTSVDSVRMEMLTKMDIPVTSLPEQEEIASFLSSVDSKIEKLERKKELWEQYKKGMMQKIFSQELRFKDENGEDYPEWEEKTIEDVLTIGSGKDYKHLSEGDIPVFGTGGYMNSVDNFLYDGETVFIGRKGTINKPFYFKGKFWTVDTLFYTYNFKEAYPKFIYALFQNIDWIKYNEASGVPSLSKTTINNIDIPLPSLPEQTQIADFLSSLDSKIEIVEKELVGMKEFKKGLLQKMFV